MEKSHNKEAGIVGEDLAVQYLERNGLEIISRNYRPRIAEIDIVAWETDRVHFVEVKTQVYKDLASLKESVLRETWRPEEKVNPRKIHKIERGAQLWVIENSYTGNVQIDAIAVRIVPRETFCTINWIQNVL
jgi:putative endonuclease